MKKALVLLLTLLVLSGALSASAEEKRSDPFAGFTGLFEVLTDCKVSDYSEEVTVEFANEALEKLLGNSPFDGDKLKNADLVEYLSALVPPDNSQPPLRYKDAGLIDREHRRAYSALNGSGRLYAENGFLKSSEPLTFGYFIGGLCEFEEEILKSSSVAVKSGKVISVSLENGVTDIRFSNSAGVFSARIKNMAEMTVAKNSLIGLYDRNISLGDEIRIYTDSEGNTIYISIPGEHFDGWSSFKNDYDLYRANVYYIDESMAIVKNAEKFNGFSYDPSASVFSEFTFDENAAFKYNLMPTDREFINENLLDSTVYIICRKNLNAEFFNISE